MKKGRWPKRMRFPLREVNIAGNFAAMAKQLCILPALLLLFSVHLGAQDVLSRRINLNCSQRPLRNILSDIEARYDVHFVYSEQFVSLSRRVTLNARRRPLRDVLTTLFKDTGIEFKAIGAQVALRIDTSAPPANLSAAPAQQRLSQAVRGKVSDADSHLSLIGANIQLLDSTRFIGASTDSEGWFTLPNVPVGRRSFMVTYLGYQPLTIRDVLIITGKELVLEIELQESSTNLEEVIVTSNIDKLQPLNDMITVSGRQFRVEEASRYPGSFQDPARMCRSFAGVSYVSDLDNDLIIRGNAPTSLLWRLEGIEIPTPNHFSAIGNTGGAISMLNSSVLTTSDFLTSAFPAEYGNTISGVFDLKFRNGNNERHEYALSAGVLGLEASVEGPLGKGRDGSSYLANYRYSTLAVLEEINLNPVLDNGIPRYQDLSFKFLWPTARAGTFALFGLGAQNELGRAPALLADGRFDIPTASREAAQYGLLGLKHAIQLSDEAYLQTIASISLNTYRYDFEYYQDSLEIDPTEVLFRERERHAESAVRLSMQYNQKFNARNAIRAGLIASYQIFDLFYRFNNERTGLEGTFLDDTGAATTLQAYAQWKCRWRDRWAVNAGAHFLYYSLNKSESLEPRLGLSYQFDERKSLRLGLGLHSYIGHVSSYLIHPPYEFGAQPFRHRRLPKSLHAVLGYSVQLTPDWHIRPEIYYQHIFDVAVSSDPSQTWVSVINILNNYDIFELSEAPIVNKGKGRNMGFEITMEKLFSKGFYGLATASIYDSRYYTADGRMFSTLFNGNYIFNLMGGREHVINKNNIIGINLKFIYAGGNRYSLIDEAASRDRGFTVFYPEEVNSRKGPPYRRIDLLASYTVNTPKTTHRLSIDIQNLLNQANVLGYYFDASSNRVATEYQIQLLFDLRYKVVF